jgi:hypothetical protein
VHAGGVLTGPHRLCGWMRESTAMTPLTRAALSCLDPLIVSICKSFEGEGP